MTLQSDIEATYSHSLSDKVKFDCKADPKDPGVGLWQWIVESHDRKSRTWSKHYVCRTGAGRYNKSPECPWDSCKDGNCYQCETGWKQ